MSERLGWVIHWLFFCFLIWLVPVRLLTNGYFLSISGLENYILETILFLAFELNPIDGIAAWLAIIGWPIQWILTGNKSFFPWKR